MNTLVTGSEGFVGNLLLTRNPSFLGCDLQSNSSNSVVLDVSDKDALLNYCREHKIEKIVHLAGAQYSIRIPRKSRESYFIQGNLSLSKSISYVADNLDLSQIVFLSTDMVYGIPETKEISETHNTRPNGPYGASKLASENTLLLNAKTCTVTIFRPRLIIGAGRTGTIQQLYKWISWHLPVPIIGKGKNRYQFIGVNDVVIAIETALSQNIQGIYNLGSDNPPEVRNLLPKVLKRLKVSNSVIKLPTSLIKTVLTLLDFFSLSPLVPEQFIIADTDFVLSTTKFRQISGWIPKESDEDLLFEALDQIRRSK
jgi:dTDP-glucose 4,6-dehydratase